MAESYVKKEHYVKKKLVKKLGLLCSLAAAAVLAGCGGGEDAAAPAPLKISGTAAVGAPLANASIQVTCSSGAATISADANGVYSVSISGGALPCVLTATSSDTLTVLHSVASGTGTSETTTNITPLSELLIAQLTGMDPANFVSGFSSSTTISTISVEAAKTALVQTLAAAGVDTTGLTDILSGTLTAGSGTGYDGVLDKLQTTLTASGSTLGDLSTAVASTSTSSTTTSSSTISTVLAPSASDCPGLKSGKLRVMDFGANTNMLVQVDASALTINDGSATYTMTKNAACDYTINDGTNSGAGTRSLVAKSGLVVLLSGTGLSGAAGLAIPEQTLDVASLAGSYDRVQYGSVFDTETGDFGDTVFDANGVNGVSTNCPLGAGNCVVDNSSKGTLVANPNGGFDYVENGVSQNRVFAFKNASGRNLLVAQDADGTLIVLAAKSALALPAVGKTNAFWQFTQNSSGFSAITEDSNTVTAVDTATSKVTRQFLDGHSDQLTFNAPFQGMRHREVNACTTSGGAPQTCNGSIHLPYGGIVVAVSSVNTKHFINVSIEKP